MDQITAAAHRFRAAIVRTVLNLPSFAAFPSGSCGDTSELLGQYFSDSGLGQWIYRTGFTTSRTHAWVEQNGILVDITADQFPDWDEPPAVIVTRDHSWHDKYFPTQSGTRQAGLEFWDGPVHEQMLRAYVILREVADELGAEASG
jgi:hypothetical protein